MIARMMAAPILLLIVISAQQLTSATKVANSLLALEFSRKYSEDVTIDNQKDIDLTQGFTVCLRTKHKYLSNSDLVKNSGTVYIYLGDYKLPSIYVQVGTLSYYTPWPLDRIKFEPLVWYSLCLAYTSSKQNILFTINREVAINHTFMAEKVATFTLKPTHTIGTSSSDPFVGIITDLNIWNKPLSLQELHYFADCNTVDISGPNRDMALRWSDVAGVQNQTGVEIIKVDYDEICSNEPQTQWMELFHFRQTINEVDYLCSLLDGRLIYPNTQEDLDHIKALINKSRHAEACKRAVWVPIRRSKDDPTKWIDTGSNEVSFLPWAEDQPNGMGLQDCIVSKDKGYSDIECTGQYCSFCMTQKYHILNLRGSCSEDSRIDSKYVLFKNENEEFIFQGFSGKSFIIGDRHNNAWKLVIGELLIGIWKPYLNFPIGIRDWMITGGYCSQTSNNSVPIKLSMVNIENNN